MADESMTTDKARAYIMSIMGKTVRIHTSDNRIFVGDLKCTDNVSFHTFNLIFNQSNENQKCNLILALTNEYRIPDLAANYVSLDNLNNFEKRFIGMVVIPGDAITKMEVERDSMQS
jgi:N-alpha-acetyltransferase 38, NatC auxiliary subunit